MSDWWKKIYVWRISCSFNNCLVRSFYSLTIFHIYPLLQDQLKWRDYKMIFKIFKIFMVFAFVLTAYRIGMAISVY